jgi:hypothetical protein
MVKNRSWVGLQWEGLYSSAAALSRSNGAKADVALPILQRKQTDPLPKKHVRKPSSPTVCEDGIIWAGHVSKFAWRRAMRICRHALEKK